MRATLLKAGPVYEDLANPDSTGPWENNQDPYTGEVSYKWDKKVDNVNTTNVNEASLVFPCLARGVQSNGIRAVGNTEHFGEFYENMEYVQIWFPTFVPMTKGDRVTDIRDSRGNIIWQDEEYRTTPRATVFNVDGVQPIPDAFNRHFENFALISKVQ